MRCFTLPSALVCLACSLTSLPVRPAAAAPATPAGDSAARDLLAAEADGDVEVKFIPNDSRSAQVVVRNRGDRPLTLRLPAAFAGVPVLAQFGMGGGGQAGGFGAGGIGGTPQNVGGGGVQNQGMGIGGAPGGNPFCWVAREVYGVHDPRWLEVRQWIVWRAPAWLQELYRERGEAFAAWLRDRPAAKAALRLVLDGVVPAADRQVAGAAFRVVTAADQAFSRPFTVAAGTSLAVRVPTVCLEYGRREPTARMPYKLAPLAKASQDPKIALLLGGLASGHLSQKVAQAAAWHVASGRSWEQLAAEVIDRAGGDPDLPVFTAAELAAAQRAVGVVTRLAAEKPVADTPAETSASER